MSYRGPLRGVRGSKLRGRGTRARGRGGSGVTRGGLPASVTTSSYGTQNKKPLPTSDTLEAETKRMEEQLNALRDQMTDLKSERSERWQTSGYHWRSAQKVGVTGAAKPGTKEPTDGGYRGGSRSTGPGAGRSRGGGGRGRKAAPSGPPAAPAAAAVDAEIPQTTAFPTRNFSIQSSWIPLDVEPEPDQDPRPAIQMTSEGTTPPSSALPDGGSLLDGEFDEDASQEGFKAAVQSWRQAAHPSSDCAAGTSTEPQPHSSTITMVSGSTGGSLLYGEFDENQAHEDFKQAVSAWRSDGDTNAAVSSTETRDGTVHVSSSGVGTDAPPPNRAAAAKTSYEPKFSYLGRDLRPTDGKMSYMERLLAQQEQQPAGTEETEESSS